MVYRRQSSQYRENLIQTLLKTEEFQAIVARHGFTEGFVKLWAKKALKEYPLFTVVVEKGDNAESGADIIQSDGGIMQSGAGVVQSDAGIMQGDGSLAQSAGEGNFSQIKIDGVPVEKLMLEYQQQRKQRVKRGTFHYDAKRYPTEPGCYLMKDADGVVIYVGKAKNLRNRLSSYFQRTLDWKKTELLVEEIADIEIIIVNNESESLFLENNLIKLHQPKYNRRLLEEDSGYAYIVLTGEEFPRLAFYRKGRTNPELEGVKGKPGEKRFGPFLNAQLLLDIAMENFKLRTCRTMPKSVCLSYHLKKCSGICQSYVDPQEYRQCVREAEAFLSYKPGERISEMKRQMLEYAENLQFERAQKLKQQIESLQSTLEKQVVERDIHHNQDIVYFGESKVLVTNIECGMIINMRMFELALELSTEDNSPDQPSTDRFLADNFSPDRCSNDRYSTESGSSHTDSSDQNSRENSLDTLGQHVYKQRCEEFLVRHYGETCPSEIILNYLPEDACSRVEKVLALVRRSKVQLTLPKKGIKHDLLKLAEKNYLYRTFGLPTPETSTDQEQQDRSS